MEIISNSYYDVRAKYGHLILVCLAADEEKTQPLRQALSKAGYAYVYFPISKETFARRDYLSEIIQALDTFTLSPYQITIGQYFAITVGVKLLTFAVFSMIITALSVVFYNYILIYFAGLGLFGLNFLFYTLSYIDANSVFKNLNLVAHMENVLRLYRRVCADFVIGNVAGMLCAQVNLDLGVSDTGDDANDLISCI